MTAVDPNLRATRTTCAYCGVGCGILATPDGVGGAAISGDPEHPANFGRLCSKGSALGETLGLTNRLLYPMIRCRKGTMERVAWSDALWYLELIRTRQPTQRMRADMMFGRSLATRSEAA